MIDIPLYIILEEERNNGKKKLKKMLGKALIIDLTSQNSKIEIIKQEIRIKNPDDKGLNHLFFKMEVID